MADLTIEQRLRPATPRCAYCHGPAELEEPGVEACSRCGTLLHTDCLAAHPECPTLGCGPWRRGELRRPAQGPAQRALRLAREARNLAVLVAVFALIAGVAVAVLLRALDVAFPDLRPYF